MAELTDYLVCYDVETATSAGRRRLRRVARICLGAGQRVQKSVFECRVTQRSFSRLRQKITEAMDLGADTVRIYRLKGSRASYLEVLGVDRSYDLDGPLLFGSGDFEQPDDPGD